MRNRIYLFDRDDTLIAKNKHLLNPHSLCNFIKQIDEAPAHHWAIISPGGNELTADDGYKAISGQFREDHYRLKKTPAYVTFNGYKSLCARVTGCSGVLVVNDKLHKKMKKNEISEAAFHQENVRAAMQHLLTADVKFGVPQEVDQATTIMIAKNARFTIQLGNTSIIIDAGIFHEHLEEIKNGTYRLFHVLAALDQVELCVEVSDALRELGIIAIASPAKYRQVQPADVIFVDAKTANCELIRKAGFTAIDADTEMYIAKLVNHTPIPAPPDTRTYFQKNPYARDLIIGFCVGLAAVGITALVFFTAGIAFPPFMICMVVGIFTPMWITVLAVGIGGTGRWIAHKLNKKDEAAENENPDALVWHGADENCQRLFTLAQLHKVFSVPAEADKVSIESEASENESESENESQAEEVTEEEMENSIEPDEGVVSVSEENQDEDVSMTEASESAEESEQEISLIQRRFG